MEGTIWLMGVCQRWHPFCRLSDWGDNALVYHILQKLFNGFPTFYGDLMSCILYWGDRRVKADCIHSRHIACSVNDWENAFLRKMVSHTSFTVTLWSWNVLFSMDWEVGSCNELFPMGWDVTLGAWSWNVLFPMGDSVTVVTWSCDLLFPMDNGVVLGAWFCRVLWWSWKGLLWCCFCFRSDFFGYVAIGVFLIGLLECKGLLNETCFLHYSLFSVWDVGNGVDHCVCTCLVRDFEFHNAQVDRSGVGCQCEGACSILENIKWQRYYCGGEVLCWTSMVKYPRNCFVC